MRIGVLAEDAGWNELISTIAYDGLTRINDMTGLPGADLFLCLKEVPVSDASQIGTPVLLNSVVVTLSEMNAPPNVWRLNGWSGFLQRGSWEIAGAAGSEMDRVAKLLGKRFLNLPDEPGFVTARIIAMIINEAYFALQDGISTTAEIDTAMKLGTNYPFGPFEWSELIGIHNVHALLQKMSENDGRYRPAAALIKAAGL